jgi:hypothetical protein
MSVGQPCGGFLCRARERDNTHRWCKASHWTVQRGSPECVEDAFSEPRNIKQHTSYSKGVNIGDVLPLTSPLPCLLTQRGGGARLAHSHPNRA